MTANSFNNTDVSVIVPLFHGTKYIENILHMIKDNTCSAENVSIELILVNDSPDDIPDFSIVNYYDYPIYTVLNEKNLGIQCARLEGAENSHGRYLLFLDQDDIISDDAIIRLYESVNGSDVAVSDWEDEQLTDGHIHAVYRTADIKHFTLGVFSYRGNMIGPPGHCLIKSESLPACWKYKIMKTSGADDFLLWIGLLAEGRSFAHCDRNLYIHKNHPGCFSNDVLNMLESADEAFKLAADEYDISRFLRFVRRRHTSYRKACFAASRRGYDSKPVHMGILLFFPCLLVLRLLDKMDIYV